MPARRQGDNGSYQLPSSPCLPKPWQLQGTGMLSICPTSQPFAILSKHLGLLPYGPGTVTHTKDTVPGTGLWERMKTAVTKI